MKRSLISAITIVVCLGFVRAGRTDDASPAMPQYSADNKLLRPDGYREWIYLSSGLGMNYSPSPGDHEMFTNVFVPQWAYQSFLKSGKWPDKTMFIVEERVSQSKGSINKTGHFQTDLSGLAVEVKDSAHNPEKWSYYGYSADGQTAEAMPKGNGCYSCHDEHAAVEHTFVQFYPTLKPVAKKFGTYNEARETVQDVK